MWFTPPVGDHDLLQTGPRLRRLVLSVLAAVAVGAVTATVLWRVIDPEGGTRAGDWKLGPWKALFFFTALAGGAAFIVTNLLLKRRDDRRWREPAKATARERAGRS